MANGLTETMSLCLERPLSTRKYLGSTLIQNLKLARGRRDDELLGVSWSWIRAISYPVTQFEADFVFSTRQHHDHP
jgi:hypothetical protein